MHYLLRVHVLDEEMASPEAFVIELDQEDAKDILTRRQLFLDVKSKVKTKAPHSIVFWDAGGDWIDLAGEHLMEQGILTEEQYEDFEGEKVLEFVSDPIQDLDDDFLASVELEMLVIMEDSVYWKACDKHSSIHFETMRIPYAFFEKLAA